MLGFRLLPVAAAVALTVTALATTVQGQEQGGAECLTHSGGVGRCVSIRHCPELLRLLRQIQANRAPRGAIQVLKDSVCDTTNQIPRICCKSGRRSSLRGSSLLPRDCGRTVLADRIVGGINASLFAWPWMALLRGRNGRDSLWICGGVLISQKYVLTAAHCVHESSGLTLEYVRLGEYQLSTKSDCESRVCAPSPQDIPVEEIVVHERYNQEKNCPRCHDIALLRLSEPARLNPAHVVPACLPCDLERDLGLKHKDFTSTFGWTAGWGTVDPSKRVPSDVLQETLLPLGKTTCDTSPFPDPNMIICAGGEGGDSCGGDSGGPLLMENPRSKRGYVVGIVSHGPTVCGAPGIQGIYTNVNFYVPWILQKLQP